MRPKYRAWDKSNKRMLYSGIHDRNWYSTPENDEEGTHCVRAKKQSDAHWLILMQSTGLHEAYQDDIVKAIIEGIVEIGAVKLDEKMAMWAWQHPRDTVFYPLWEIFSVYQGKIIGNVHEHKNLLEAGK